MSGVNSSPLLKYCMLSEFEERKQERESDELSFEALFWLIDFFGKDNQINILQ